MDDGLALAFEQVAIAAKAQWRARWADMHVEADRRRPLRRHFSPSRTERRDG